MQNRTPVPRAERDLSFVPVPRKYRHDGWTPERQKAFIEALADTGSVSRAARMVNMSGEGVYALRRQPGAESFRRAWEAALDFGVQRLKDIAFERAIEGQLVPVFVAGKLMGFRRKKNDRLLMFCLRHYGQDANGRRVTVNYFSSRATAAAHPSSPSGEGRGAGESGEPRALAAAEASTTTIRTITSDPGQGTASARLERDDRLAATLNAFEGVRLDAAAQAEILRVLESCAERARASAADWNVPLPERLAAEAADPDREFVRLPEDRVEYLGELESGAETDDFLPFVEGEPPWESLGEPVPEWFSEWQERQERQEKGLAAPEEEESAPASSAPADPEPARAEAGPGEGAPCVPPPEPDPDDPRLDWRNWTEGRYIPPADPPPADPPPCPTRTGKPQRRDRKRRPTELGTAD